MPNNPRAAENLTPVKPGQILNPKGRGKGVPNTATRLQRLLTLVEKVKNPVTGDMEDFTVAEVMDMMQIVKARKGDTKAYNSLIDRLEGKAMQKIEQEITGQLDTSPASSEEAKRYEDYLKGETKK